MIGGNERIYRALYDLTFSFTQLVEAMRRDWTNLVELVPGEEYQKEMFEEAQRLRADLEKLRAAYLLAYTREGAANKRYLAIDRAIEESKQAPGGAQCAE